MLVLIKYIYDILPKFFILSLIFTILMGLRSVLSVWSLRMLINTISDINDLGNNDLLIVIIVFGTINILVMVIQSLNSIVISKHRMIIDYEMGMDVLNKCKTLTLKDFESSENYNIIARAEGEGRGKVVITYNNLLGILMQTASFLILSTIVNTRIGYKNYKIRMSRMSDVRMISYINYLLIKELNNSLLFQSQIPVVYIGQLLESNDSFDIALQLKIALEKRGYACALVSENTDGMFYRSNIQARDHFT